MTRYFSRGQMSAKEVRKALRSKDIKAVFVRVKVTYGDYRMIFVTKSKARELIVGYPSDEITTAKIVGVRLYIG